MFFDVNIPSKAPLKQEALLLTDGAGQIYRPMQAWQWMVQSRLVPDQGDWVQKDVIESWRRCLEDYRLPLGAQANWDNSPIVGKTLTLNAPSQRIEALIKQLDHNFHVFLKEAGVTMLLAAPDGRLLYVLGKAQPAGSFMARASQRDANWLEPVMGNNGIGTAAELKRPATFQGMEHYLSVLHPYTTVGYPLLDEAGQLLAVVGLVSDNHQESMASLFAFLHLICVLVNADVPLAKNPNARQRVLEKIPLKAATGKKLGVAGPATTPVLDEWVQKAVKLQQYKIPILITGESGVGKDHFVNLIKDAGPRKNAPLIAINCASIPHDLIESELFGYEPGSFTGAKSCGKPGKFMLADTGILFLDEIGDMSLDLQSTLLRVLETSEFTPVGGGAKPIRVDVQVVAATNVQLLKAVEAGRFRRDLYYRLNGAQIHLPPLRQRPDKVDIIRHILHRELNVVGANGPIEIAPDVLRLFESHPWPGNIRQLINVIRATLYTADDQVVTVNDLPSDFIAELRSQPSPEQGDQAFVAIKAAMPVMSLSEWELFGIKTALQDSEGNVSVAAKNLGITRTTLYKKMEHFGLKKNAGDGLRHVCPEVCRACCPEVCRA